MIEDRALHTDLALERPVPALQAISHDPSLRTTVALRDGRRLTGVQACSGPTSSRPPRGSTTASVRTRTPTPSRCCSAGSRCSPGSSATRWSARASSTGSPVRRC
nr:proteasome accessory factor PafA2 family protein [Angustibacter aerolatus]